MKSFFDVIIVGGGLAGLTAAIHLSQVGKQVLLIEKGTYPRHKVCGEYISNEVLHYFKYLKIDLEKLHPVKVTRTSISTVSGRKISSDLPIGGFGLSRFALDNLLYQTALDHGCEIVHKNADDIIFDNQQFTVTCDQQSYHSTFVLGAFGKRSSIDQKLHRGFMRKKSPWLAVKAHYSGDFPNDVVELHNFRGGYCGVSKVEDNIVNVCYLADYDTFKKHRNISEYQQSVVCQNPHLKSIFDNMTMLYDKPLTISQISFERKRPVENHILMIGDTAGLIHPLCGNGMAMAIHSAKVASELLIEYFAGDIKSRDSVEKNYLREWNHHFNKRMRTGKFLASVFQNHRMAELAMNCLTLFPSLLPKIIKRTHGKTLIQAV